mmetsp:Transcript_87372/g.247971  ORF Transcript_87372/g.247971 Transcript_87372/m.247971 type:complete len:233 (+) Transcript_87372:89-787(+)
MATAAVSRLASRCCFLRQHRGVFRFLFIALFFAPTLHMSDGASVRQYGCKQQNYCNGHGTCVAPSRGTPRAICECFETWGAPTDPVQPSNDCTLRTCPLGPAVADVPKSNQKGHSMVECSNAGSCDRESGVCKCMSHRAGRACEIMLCPSDCSGHGMCHKMVDLPKMVNALPLSNMSLTAIRYQDNQVSRCLRSVICPSFRPTFRLQLRQRRTSKHGTRTSGTRACVTRRGQ